MNNQTILKQIMREYEILRNNARLDLEERKARIYKDIPRTEEIDNEIMRLGARISKCAFSADADAQELILELKEKSNALKAEKSKLMEDRGYTDDFLKMSPSCEICKDTGYVGNERCRCFKQKLIEKYYEMSTVKDVFKQENFDTFDFRFYSAEKDEKTGVSPLVNIQKIYSSCNKFVKNFKQDRVSLLFSGKAGRGKTFLCNCIAKEVIDSGHSVLYTTAPAMFKRLEEYRFSNDKTEEMAERIGMLSEVDLLIIDDLGSEFYTVITGTELFDIVNSRMLSRKSTIISTNLSEEDLQRTYSDRIASRFLGNYRMYYFFGEDIRIKKRLMG